MGSQSSAPPRVEVEVIAYAPTEFFHCGHCEAVFQHIDLGQRLHEEQRASQLPPDLQAEYAAISDWMVDAMARYGSHINLRLIDAVSFEGLWASLRHKSRRFPVFVIDGGEQLSGFEPERLNAAIDRRLQAKEVVAS